MRLAGFVTFIVLVCLEASLVESSSDGFHYVTQALPKFETKYGAFRFTETDDRVSLEATSHALFLSNLLGLNNQIDITAVSGFLQSIRNPDHGYSQLPGYASDLESVRQAVLSYQRLGQSVPDSPNVAAYIQSLLQKDTSLFSNRAGEAGHVKFTAYAFQVLQLLGLEPQFLKEAATNARQYLKNHHKETPEHTHFAFEEFGAVSGNYYAILLGSYTGYEFKDLEKWAAYIASFQSKDGGFYADTKKTVISLEATANALASIHILASQSKGSSNLLQKINLDKLAAYVQRVPRNLKQVAFAHLANAIARPVAEFQTSVQYETPEPFAVSDTSIIQGSHVKPCVATINPALSVEVAITAGSTIKNLKLRWKDSQYIADEFFDTSNILGAIGFVYTIRSYALETGTISATVTDIKHIGYSIDVSSQSSFEGQEIHEGDNVGHGAQFSFSLSLSNITNKDFSSGDFDVLFTVLDSSLVAIHSHSINGRGNSKPVTFSYTLDASNIPSGDLICRFEVKNTNGVHSVRNVAYKFAVQMLATEILFKGFAAKAPVYKIGETVEVSIVPATYSDRNTVQQLKSEASHHFELQVKSLAGTTLQTVEGVFDGKKRYVFKFPLTSTLDSVGTKVVSFIYTTTSGTTFNLQNYDTAKQALLDEHINLSFFVDAELHVADLQLKPNNQDLYYGDSVSLQFKVKDVITGKFLSAVDWEGSAVYLELKHVQPGSNQRFVSTQQVAACDGDTFNMEWFINPNAVRGAGILGLSVHDIDGNGMPLLKDGSKEEFSQNIVIGGDIESDSSVMTTSHADAKETALTAHFHLKCRNQLLRSAQLKALVSFVGEVAEEVLFQTRVATDDTSYEISFSLPHKAVRTGEYKIKVYRQADTDNTKPLLEISRRLEGSENALPVRTELILLITFVAALAGLNLNKSQY